MSNSHRNKSRSSHKVHKKPDELVLRDTDVICGRGTGTAAFIGNVEFRFICYKVKELYKTAQRQEKSKIAQKIMDQIAAQSPPGRFVELLEGTTVEERRCILAPFEQALEKTCQALREKKNGCPRQYRQFESKRRPSSKVTSTKSVPSTVSPRFSEKEFSIIKKNIEQVTGKKCPSPGAPRKLVEIEEPPMQRKTSRQIMMDHNLAKRQVELAKSAQADEAKSKPVAKKRVAPPPSPPIEKAVKKSKPVETRVVPPKGITKTATVPKAETKVVVPKAETKGLAATKGETKIVVPKAPAPKVKIPQTKPLEKPVITFRSVESDEDSLPENSLQARIFSSSRTKARYQPFLNMDENSRSTEPDTVDWRLALESGRPAVSTKMFQGNVNNFYMQPSVANRSSLSASNADVPKYPFVPYPYCFLQSLAALDAVPEPAKLTADVILASFSLDSKRAAGKME
jgi:hypothetical protein